MDEFQGRPRDAWRRMRVCESGLSNISAYFFKNPRQSWYSQTLKPRTILQHRTLPRTTLKNHDCPGQSRTYDKLLVYAFLYLKKKKLCSATPRKYAVSSSYFADQSDPSMFVKKTFFHLVLPKGVFWSVGPVGAVPFQCGVGGGGSPMCHCQERDDGWGPCLPLEERLKIRAPSITGVGMATHGMWEGEGGWGGVTYRKTHPECRVWNHLFKLTSINILRWHSEKRMIWEYDTSN